MEVAGGQGDGPGDRPEGDDDFHPVPDEEDDAPGARRASGDEDPLWEMLASLPATLGGKPRAVPRALPGILASRLEAGIQRKKVTEKVDRPGLAARIKSWQKTYTDQDIEDVIDHWLDDYRPQRFRKPVPHWKVFCQKAPALLEAISTGRAAAGQ